MIQILILDVHLGSNPSSAICYLLNLKNCLTSLGGDLLICGINVVISRPRRGKTILSAFSKHSVNVCFMSLVSGFTTLCL